MLISVKSGEEYPMKKIAFIMCCILILSLAACSNRQENTQISKWDCSVNCAEQSTPDEYVITYSDEKLTSQTGALTFHNGNEFEITIHLLDNGEEEQTKTIPAGSSTCLKQIKENTEYTIGIHADVPEDTSIKLTAYDGEKTDIDL